MADDNPFLALFEPIQQKSESFGAKKDTSPKRDLKEDNTAKIVQSINQEIENIFAFTINPYTILGRSNDDPIKKHGIVLLESFSLSVQHDQSGRSWMDLDVLGQALFERLLLQPEDLKKSVLYDQGSPDEDSHAVNSKVCLYLSECYMRCHSRQVNFNKKVSFPQFQ